MSDTHTHTHTHTHARMGINTQFKGAVFFHRPGSMVAPAFQHSGPHYCALIPFVIAFFSVSMRLWQGCSGARDKVISHITQNNRL